MEQKTRSISAELERKYGKRGTPERQKFDEEAYAFYTGQILLNARKEARMTQADLAEKTGTTKSYISKVENGEIEPSAARFYRMIGALGMRVEIVKTI